MIRSHCRRPLTSVWAHGPWLGRRPGDGRVDRPPVARRSQLPAPEPAPTSASAPPSRNSPPRSPFLTSSFLACYSSDTPLVSSYVCARSSGKGLVFVRDLRRADV